MKFSLAWTAVFLPVFVNAQSSSSSSSSAAAPSASASNSNNINVCRPSVMLSIFVDVPQVVVSPGGALAFSPSNITATNGTSVTFVFPQYELPYVMYLQWYSHHSADRSVAHSVTQSTFENPCTYLAAGNGSSAGFDSGLQTAKQFTITITNDQERKPTFLSPSLFFPFIVYLTIATAVWFFCKQVQHCGLGMVG